jgi:hypothetical protein
MEYPYSILGKDACQQTASFSGWNGKPYYSIFWIQYCGTILAHTVGLFFSPTACLRLPYAWSAVDDLEELGII